MAMITIDDQNYTQYTSTEYCEQNGRMRGMKPRNYSTKAVGTVMYAKRFDEEIIPESKRQGMLDARISSKSQLSDIRNISGPGGKPIPSLDQGQMGYCWGHSPVTAMGLMLAIMGEPWADLSAYSVAAPIKNFRNEGGWNYEAVEYIGEHGVATGKTWPQRDLKRSDIQASAEERMHFRFIDWIDLDPQGDLLGQVLTCLLLGYPIAGDFPWWSHSVCIVDIISLMPLILLIWNSWGDIWSENGMGQLKGDKAIPKGGAIALRVAYASAA